MSFTFKSKYNIFRLLWRHTTLGHLNLIWCQISQCLRFKPHLPLLDSLSSLKKKKNPVFFSTALFSLHPSLLSFTIPLLPLPSVPFCFFLALLPPPSLAVYDLGTLLVFSYRPLALPVSPRRASTSHPYLSNVPVGLLSLWKHDLQPSNSRLYTDAFSSCSQSLPADPCTPGLAYRAPTAPVGHGPASKITWRVKHQ